MVGVVARRQQWVVMTTFLALLSTAADFALTLNLKAAIVAAGFILMLVQLTRRRGAE